MKLRKTLLLVVTMIIAFCSTCPLVGCNSYLGVDTDDEILSELSNATKNFLEYDGPLTINMKVDLAQEITNDQQNESTIVYSVHPGKGKMFFSLKSELVTVDVKVFKHKNKSYVFTSQKVKTPSAYGNTTHEEATCEVLSPASANVLASRNYFSILAQQDINQMLKEYDYDFTTTKNAMKKVVEEQVQKKQETDAYAGAAFDMRTEKTSNSIAYQLNTKIKKVDYLRGKYGLIQISNKEKVVGKGGKIAQIMAETALSFSYSKKGENSKIDKASVIADIGYSFDNKGYTDVSVTVGKEYAKTFTYSEPFTMSLELAGVKTKKSTVAYNFDPEDIVDDLTLDLQCSGTTIDWFLDKEHTKPFIAKDLTQAQLHQVGNLYGKLNINPNYAVIARDYTIIDNRSQDYKAVFGPMSHGKEQYEVFESQKLSGKNDVYHLPTISEEFNSYLNGVPYDEGYDVTLEGGKLYLITIEKVLTDADCSIFDLVTDVFI